VRSVGVFYGPLQWIQFSQVRPLIYQQMKQMEQRFQAAKSHVDKCEAPKLGPGSQVLIDAYRALFKSAEKYSEAVRDYSQLI
jgi:hypothetical protein